MIAGDVLLSISTAPSGSTARTHILSAQSRLDVIGLNLSSNVESITSSNDSDMLSSNLSTSIDSNNTTEISSSSISTLTATISC